MPTPGRRFTLAVPRLAALCVAPRPARLSVPTAQAQGFDHAALSGSAQTYGPGNAAWHTNGTVLEPTDSWAMLNEHPPPGETYLLHGGINSINTTPLMPADRLGQSITAKPYNYKVVTFKSTYSPPLPPLYVLSSGDLSTNAAQLL